MLRAAFARFDVVPWTSWTAEGWCRQTIPDDEDDDEEEEEDWA